MIQRVKSFFALQVHHLISYQKVYANLPSRRQLTEIFLCSGTLATTTIVFKAGADSKNLGLFSNCLNFWYFETEVFFMFIGQLYFFSWNISA